MTVFTFNTNHQVTSIKRFSGLLTTNIYGADHHLATTIDVEIGRTNSLTYTNGLIYTHTDERGLTITNTWDALQRKVRVDFPDGTFITNAYDKLDLVRVVDRMGFSNSFAYDTNRKRTAATNANGAVTLYSYCTCGALDSVRDAEGNSTGFYYDNLGRMTNVSYADGYGTTFFYDSLNQITNIADAGGVSITNWFNSQGLLVAVSNAFGLVGSVSFDILDRATNSTDARNVSVAMAYDNLDRIITRTYGDGGVERFGYSPNVSSASAYTNQLNKVSTFGYDPAGRLVASTNANSEITVSSYSAAWDLLTLTDGLNQATSWHYDSFGRVTNKVDAANNVVLALIYDANNRLTNRWTPVSSNTAYLYDPHGNLLSVGYQHSSNNVSMAYDRLNRATNMVDAVGTNRFVYNAASQLLSEDGPWVSDTVTFGYSNRLRNLAWIGAPTGSPWTNTYAYDITRRLTNVTSPAGVFGYRYLASRPASLISRLSLPGGAFITNIFDSQSRLTSTALKNSGGAVLDSHSYLYDLGNERTQQVFAAGNFVNYSYDPIGQLKAALGAESSGTTNRLSEQFGYGYDPAGNLRWRTNNALVQAFNVNNLNELTTETNSGTLTVAGNTTSAATNVTINALGAAIYSDNTFAKAGFGITNGTNAFTAIARNAAGRSDTNTISLNFPGTNNFTYDLNGNLLSDGNRTFAYDDENQLTSVTASNAWRSEFQYDGRMRRRIRREYTWQSGIWSPQSETRYIYDGTLVIQERDQNNLPIVTYTRGADLSGSREGAGGIGGLLARSQPSAPTAQNAIYFADGSGNVTALVNTNGLIVAKYLYDPFGNTLSLSGPLAQVNLYRFSSKEVHFQSGLSYYLFRFYDPNLQRWLNRDPIQELGGINLYNYVANNPVHYTDALGLKGNPISSTFPTLHGMWNSDLGGGGGSFYGPGFYQSLAIQQANAAAAARAAAIAAFNATVPSDFWLGADGYTHSGISDLSYDFFDVAMLGGMLGGLIDGVAVKCTEGAAEGVQPALTGTEAARAALGKGPFANPGAPLTAEMRAALQENLAANQNNLNLAQQGLNRAGDPFASTQARQAAINAAQNRINEINEIIESGLQAPKN